MHGTHAGGILDTRKVDLHVPHSLENCFDVAVHTENLHNGGEEWKFRGRVFDSINQMSDNLMKKVSLSDH